MHGLEWQHGRRVRGRANTTTPWSIEQGRQQSNLTYPNHRVITYRSLAISRHLGLFPQTSKNDIRYSWRYWVRDNKTIFDRVQCLYNQAKYRKLTVNCLPGTANLYKPRWRLIASSDVMCKRPIEVSLHVGTFDVGVRTFSVKSAIVYVNCACAGTG